ncbi:MAG: AMP-binding protein, partial [Planctomycetes bacterium]|nr:AMP-binding protein [Planctomycetota bacterium]
PGQYIGIMMPASVGVNVVYLATLFAGKTPVMINWTLGRKYLKHCLESLGIERIVTASAVVSRIKTQGIDLSDFQDRFVCLEDIRQKLSIAMKLGAWLKSRLSWSSLRRVDVSQTAVLLFTSGSESVPKIVPLSHTNVLTNISDIYDCVTIRADDNILGILPPFHAFGLTASMLLPLCMGMRAAYYPNPNDGGPIGQVIDAYKVSILIGTPTFLYGIVRASNPDKLGSLRLVVSGAEKCPMRTYEALAASCPNTIVMEGYGVTECSPVISVNHENDPHKGTIGKIMTSLEYAIVDQNMSHRVETGHEGMLLVHGPSVFDGYLNYQGDSPFVSFEDKSWYSTGDLVRENDKGVLTFAGRKKRFIKLGGEMISLPAIESVLETHYVTADDEGPVLAVTATTGDRPEIVLFAVKDLDRVEVNQQIRESGLSGIHNIRRVIKLDQLPLLGTGKTDYRTLVEQLAGNTGD